MEEKLTDALGQIISWLESGEAFIVEQAPLVAQEYLRWVTVSSLVWCVLSLMGLIACHYAGRRIQAFVTETAPYDGKEAGAFVRAVFQIIASAILIIGFCVNLHYLLFVLTAPRVVVLEKVASLL